MAATIVRGIGWETITDDAITVSGTNNGTSIECLNWDMISCQTVVTTIGVGSATMRLESSNDGTYFDAITGSDMALAMAAANTATVSLTQLPFKFIRCSCSSAATSGAVTPYFVFKKRR